MIKFTILYDNKRDVFVKTKDGLLTFENYDWHFFIDHKDYESNKQFFESLIGIKYVSRYEVEGEYVAIHCLYFDRGKVISQLKSHQIKTYEDDLRPFQRFLVDEDVELEVNQSILYFDIETDDRGKGIAPGRDAILSIAAIGSDGQEFFFSYREEDKNGEVRMLRKFIKVMDTYDILAGWHSEGFDLPAISYRINGRKTVKYDPITGERLRWDGTWVLEGLNLKLPRAKQLLFECPVIEQTAKDLGGLDSVRRLGMLKAKPSFINHLDLMQKFKEMHYRDTELIKKVRSFSLSTVSQVILGEDKVDLHGESIYKLWKERPDDLEKYNMQDVRLLVKLDKALNISMQKLVEHQVCCARINDYTSHGKIDVFALRGAKRMGKHLPSKPDDPKKAKVTSAEGESKGNEEPDYQGGFVFDPVTGLHKNVYIFDFQSLYPSIIKTFNVSIDSLKGVTEWSENMKIQKDDIILPTGAIFDRNVVGIIPSIIQYVLDQRNHIRHVEMKNLKKDSLEYQNAHYRQYAFKVLANSMYGIMGASFSRYFKRELAEGITLTGQYIIKHMWEWLQGKGLTPIYGDTDSLFFVPTAGDVDTEKLSNEIKEHLDELLVRLFNVKENQIIMDFKGKFPMFLSVGKKKYAGINEQGEMEVTGLEVKKRDTLPKASTWQQEILDSLLKGENDVRFYMEWVRFNRKSIDFLTLEEITFQKRISKEIEEYGKIKNGRTPPIPAHVKVAQWVKDNGSATTGDKINLYSQGAYIPFIIIGSKDGIKAIHPLQFTGQYDKDYYWHACFDPSKRLLEAAFPQIEWDDDTLRTKKELQDIKDEKKRARQVLEVEKEERKKTREEVRVLREEAKRIREGRAKNQTSLF